MDIRDKVFLRLQAIEDQTAAAGREHQLAKMKGDDEAAERFAQQRITLIDEWNRIIHTVSPEPGAHPVPLIHRNEYSESTGEAIDATLDFAKSLGLPLRHDVNSDTICAMVKHKLDELSLKILTIEHFASQAGLGPGDDDPFDLGLGDIDFSQ